MEIGIREIDILGNTPGGWYAVFYSVAVLIFLSSNRKKQTGYKRYLSLTAASAFIIILMSVTNGVNGINYVLVMSAVLAALFFEFFYNMDGRRNNYLYYMLRAFMWGEFTASFGWQIYYFLVMNFGFRIGYPYQAAVMIPVGVVVAVVTIMLEKQHSKGNRDMEISGQALFGALIIVGLLYAFSNLSYVITGTPFTTTYSSELFIIRTSADFMGVILLYFYHELLQQTAQKVEAETIKNMLELQYSQYLISEESMALVNQKYHDLKHQITMLKADLASGSDTDGLDQMLKDIKKYEAQYKTGNRVLDTMLSAESLKCQARDIEFTCVADGEALSFMKPMDISALFGNALDNAIESAEQIVEKKERLIYLTVERQKGFLNIDVENRYAGRVNFRHHLPLTTKNDTSLHGYGVKSMKQIAESYGGSIRASADDGWFKLFILIPIPEESQ
ncbi:MAG: sensor histidine kinase [Lachnospiraceae bacterium]|nr:sensor histidine kinase [Lachnospiraceae bacterium]